MAPAILDCACSLGARGTAIRCRCVRNTDRCTGPLCVVPIIDQPISDHMNRCKQDVTSDIIAYYM
ncbi:unnamed protein product [Staurois parvus]|uniref:Uncharacterized protein n=1 Tax=Staurois parvus TaxID=386267 RepID=A0ABN9AIR0_9NEOB|nr:unnamed protein product [Staurois parvus]